MNKPLSVAALIGVAFSMAAASTTFADTKAELDVGVHETLKSIHREQRLVCRRRHGRGDDSQWRWRQLRYRHPQEAGRGLRVRRERLDR